MSDTRTVYIPLPEQDDPSRWSMHPMRYCDLNEEGRALLEATQRVGKTLVLESGDNPEVVAAAQKYLASIEVV